MYSRLKVSSEILPFACCHCLNWITFVQVFLEVSLSSTSVTQAVGMSPDFAKVKTTVNSIFGILDRKSKIDPSDMSGKILKDPRGEIEFTRVAFFYPTRPDVQIFQELSFKVQAGQVGTFS